VKLGGAEARRYLARPDPGKAGLLIYGPDAMRVALRRQEAVAALIGPEGAAEMRLTRIAAGELRRDPAALPDALAARGFFPGPRVVLVEDAGDAQAETIAAALDLWRPGDAVLVVTAGALAARSALRRAFETAPAAVAAPVYADPPTRDEIETALAKAGLAQVGRAAMDVLGDLARALDPGDFAQTLEKLALYKRGDPTPLGAEDLAAIAPPPGETALDAVLDLVAEGRAGALPRQIQRLEAQGVAATTLAIGAGRHFRLLYAAAAAPDGPERALARVRPPVFGPRRDRMVGQARALGPARLEKAIMLLTDADLALRSSRPAPAMALIERALIRIATLHPDRQAP
jgi:DNA polymerase III subunit delta